MTASGGTGPERRSQLGWLLLAAGAGALGGLVTRRGPQRHGQSALGPPHPAGVVPGATPRADLPLVPSIPAIPPIPVVQPIPVVPALPIAPAAPVAPWTRAGPVALAAPPVHEIEPIPATTTVPAEPPARRLRRTRRFVRGTVRAAGVLVVVAAVAVLLVTGIGPRIGGYRVLTVLSDSMRPRMPAGALAFETPEPAASVRVGQVITYKIPVLDHHVVTHRVIQVLQPGPHPVVQTKGDASQAQDPWRARLDDGQVWRVRWSVPWLGRAVNWLRRPTVHKATTAVAPFALAAFWLVDIWGKRGRRRPAAPSPSPA